ncbi:MAG: HAD family hydrolase [Acidobacteria bacterium]|nr:HAD family hydrolase [Acidobacteriota bacterium]
MRNPAPSAHVPSQSRSGRRNARSPDPVQSPDGQRRAVFFDRDGTLNEEVGYVNHPDRFQIFPFAAQAVREAKEAGLLAIVVSNQSGVARGLFSESLVQKLHRRLAREIIRQGGKLDAIFYCPHHPQGRVEKYRRDCTCRKPSSGLLEKAAADFGIHLASSFVVGDRYVDVAMAHRVGARSVLVLTGYGRGEWEYFRKSWPQPPDYVAKNVRDAVRWILRNL